MSLKEKSIFKKYVFEYESPDGDKWEITIAESGDRKYVQYLQTETGQNSISKPLDTVPITIDGEMLLDMADAYRNVTSKYVSPVAFKGVNKNAITAPQVVDHRKSVEESGTVIQSKVDETMKNQDSGDQPVQSLSKPVDDYTEFRSGVSPEVAAQEPGETPESWSLNKEGEDLAAWKKEALSRKEKIRPAVQGRTGGYERPNFKQVEAKDII
jgi:hypothetical protein